MQNTDCMICGCWHCGNRVYLHLPIIDGNNEEEIVNALVDAYNKMKKITDEIH
ncbi:hypothetical protein [Segatella maculosa]|uniref:hypothetical protein n=1 Tax=Segatella maculosa TaxID=439703 RepID=UPI0024936A81|nr:hypothetical protein [Segatella maculosa]